MSAGHRHPDSTSSSYDDASPLHFHGLAVTQTQTQVPSCAEGSGKDSIPSETRVCIHFRSTLLYAPLRQLIVADISTVGQVMKRRKVCHDADISSPSELPLKVSNITSDTKSTSRSSSKLKRRRSPSIDSFAGAEEWEDPAKVFLAANSKFELPLSELGRDTTQEDYREDKHHRPPLREPTLPSHKQSNRGSGALPDDVLSPLSDVPPDAPRPDNTHENDTFDVSDNASTPPLVSNPGSMDHIDTQVEDYQATQPLADEDLDADTTQVSDVGVLHVEQSSPQEYTCTNSRPSTNTRNILGMVNPMKKWRHQQGQLLQQQHAVSDNIPDGQTQPSVDFSRSTNAPSTGRRLFEQLAAQMHSEPQSVQQGRNNFGLRAIDEDSRETVVVPDSEPGDAPPSSGRAKSPTPGDPLHRSPSPRPVIRDKIAQPDAGTNAQTDDDDDDVPLMLTVGRPAPRITPPSGNAGEPPKVWNHSHYACLCFRLVSRRQNRHLAQVDRSNVHRGLRRLGLEELTRKFPLLFRRGTISPLQTLPDHRLHRRAARVGKANDVTV